MSIGRKHHVSQLHGKPAGVVTRTLAGVIDYVLAGAIVLIGHLSITALRFVTNPVGFSWPRTSWFLLIIAGGVVLVFYLTLSWGATGKPLGGSIMGTRVVNRHGQRLGLALALVRAVLVVLLPIGLLWCAINPAGRSLQDIALRTRVIYDYDIVTSYPVHETP